MKAPEDQQKHIDDYYEKDGVRGDPANIFIFTSQPGECIPPLGLFLGDLTSELDCGERERRTGTHPVAVSDTVECDEKKFHLKKGATVKKVQVVYNKCRVLPDYITLPDYSIHT